MRNILIIGANGFTGRQLLKDLSAHKQYNVTGCSLHSDIFPALENTKKYRFIEVDIRNEASDRKSTRLNSSHTQKSRMPSSA